MNLVEVRNLRIEARTDSGRVVEIVRDLSFDIAEGEIVALIGESGSGKTTVALSLLGYARGGCQIVGGSVHVAGQRMTSLSERQLSAIRGIQVAYVPQSAAAAFNPAQTVMDQIIEVARIHKTMSAADARDRAIDLFRNLSLPESATIGDRYPHQVSGGQLQRLSVAMALIGDPKLVIFDEPTTALDVTTQAEVLHSIKCVMKQGGKSGLYVSHDLAVVAQIAGRIVVLKNGEIQESGATQQILSAPTNAYSQELLAAFRPPARSISRSRQSGPQPLLKAENLVAGYGRVTNGAPALTVLKSVNLTVNSGQNIGIVGESGSGKSTLAKVIAGILPAMKGGIVFDGALLAPAAANRTQDELRKLQIVFQSADTALNPAKSVGEILGRALTFYRQKQGRDREEEIHRLLDRVHLPRSIKYRLPAELSGGQKQRINFARALAAEPKLILCDEITSALDTVVAAAIIDLLKELQRELSLSYIFISHDLSLVEAICDEIAVMYGGEKIEQIDGASAGTKAKHPYSRQLFSSVPKLDMNWLDTRSCQVETLAE